MKCWVWSPLRLRAALPATDRSPGVENELIPLLALLCRPQVTPVFSLPVSDALDFRIISPLVTWSLGQERQTALGAA
jgi:hypothetical protein